MSASCSASAYDCVRLRAHEGATRYRCTLSVTLTSRFAASAFRLGRRIASTLKASDDTATTGRAPDNTKAFGPGSTTVTAARRSGDVTRGREIPFVMPLRVPSPATSLNEKWWRRFNQSDC